VAAAVNSADALLTAQDKRIKAIGAVREAIGGVVDRVTEVEADAAVVGGDLFKMQGLARVREQKGGAKVRGAGRGGRGSAEQVGRVRGGGRWRCPGRATKSTQGRR